MSAIEWTDATWNPIVGCTRLSAGCDHCYAETMSRRQLGMNTNGKLAGTRPQYIGVVDISGFTGVIGTAPDHIWRKPLTTRKPTTWFVNSMSDMFHQNVADDDILHAFEIMNECPQHNFQVLTKRPSRAVAATERLGLVWSDNIWFGTSIEHNKFSIQRTRELLKVPAALHFISAEPLIGKLPDLDVSAVDWVIAGGESGRATTVRPADADWFRDLRDRCREAGTPFFFKQWGEHNEFGIKVGKELAGHHLDGEEIWEMPATVFDRMSDAAKKARWTRATKPALSNTALGFAANRPHDRAVLGEHKVVLLADQHVVGFTDDETDEFLHNVASDGAGISSRPNANYVDRSNLAVVRAAMTEVPQTIAEIAGTTGLSYVTVQRYARMLNNSGEVSMTKSPLRFALAPSLGAITAQLARLQAQIEALAATDRS